MGICSCRSANRGETLHQLNWNCSPPSIQGRVDIKIRTDWLSLNAQCSAGGSRVTCRSEPFDPREPLVDPVGVEGRRAVRMREARCSSRLQTAGVLRGLHEYEAGTWGPKEVASMTPPGGWQNPLLVGE